MSRWRQFREFLALGADVIGVAIGLGVIVAAIVGLWNQASLHLGEPWLAMILLGVFLLAAGLAGRALRYLPSPPSHRGETPKSIVEKEPPQKSQEDVIEADLRHLVAERLHSIPLRPYETQIVVLILREAIQSLNNPPFISMQPGNEATDVQLSGKRRQSSDVNGEQMWHLPTKFKGAGGEGIIFSDQTLDTLTDLHKQVMSLRREVYDRYHKPTLPGRGH